MPKIRIVETEDFEVELSQNIKRNVELENSLVHFKSSKGFPAYNLYYRDLEKHVYKQVDFLNQLLRKKYILNYCRSSVIMDLKDPCIVHYKKRFPEKQFLVQDPLDQTVQFGLKPACCLNALKIWANKKSFIPKKEIMHEVSDCYRREDHGALKSFRRGSFFNLPDYHMTTIESDYLSDFETVKDAFYQTYENMWGSNWAKDFCEIYRVDSAQYAKYEGFILKNAEKSKMDHVIIHKVQYPDLDSKPYYKLKYEVSYRGAEKIYALGTIQIDTLYPELFGLDKLKYGLKPVLHFSPGAVIRFVDVMINNPLFYPKKGVKIYTLADKNAVDLKERLKLKCSVLIDNKSKNLKECLASNNYAQKTYFPKIIIYGEKESEADSVTVIQRNEPSKNRMYKIDEFRDLINSDRSYLDCAETHYSSTFCGT